MTSRNITKANSLDRWLARWRRVTEEQLPLPLEGGPAWRNRASLPARFSYAIGLLAALTSGPGAQAGDLLRGGAAAGARGNASGVNASSAQATAQARANAKDVLSRTTQAVKAVQALQNAARSAAINGPDNLGRNPVNGLQLPNVPNGLTPGGLVVDTGGTWTGAYKPTQTTSDGQTLVNIQQTASQAVLTWKSFNIGKKTILNFDQNLGGNQTSQWVAYNKINDPTGVPSQILGSIRANGQVFVINRNGIIFGGSSQVNTHALFASTLPINDNLINSGLLANPDQQFLFTGLAIPAGANGTPAFTPDAPYNSDYGDVTVQPGATLTAPTTTSHVGGRVVLVGRNATNAGTISTPDGQTIIAAGRQVGFSAHPSTDPTLRGLDTFVGNADNGSGTATNSGLISAPRADTMITGRNVQQLGVIDSSTSVTLNGRVDLLADYNTTHVRNQAKVEQMVPNATGSVTLGVDSVTQILPETSSSETNVGTQLPLPSQVIIQGQTIRMESNSIVLAPGAAVPPNPSDPGGIKPALDIVGNALSSGVTFNAGSWGSSNTSSTYTFVNDKGQISLETGATINVAGSTDVNVPIRQNILSVQLRGSELADSPTQRQGVFRGSTIDIDIRKTGVFNGQYWVGSPIADVSGFVGLIQRTAAELTVAGGTTSLNAGGSVILKPGATIDVSGGWIHFQGGLVQTTRVVSGGNVVDISQASPDRVYAGFYTGTYTSLHTKWGVSQEFSSPLALSGTHWENSYDQGANGGSLAINAPTMSLEGTMRGYTVTGDRELRTTASSSTLPAPSSLKLAFQAQDRSITTLPTYSPTPPKIVFQSGSVDPTSNSFAVDSSFRLTGARASNVVLSADLLTQNGFGSLTVDNRDGDITLPSPVSLKAAPGGGVTLFGANIDIEGTISAPGGSLAFNVYDLPTSLINSLQTSNPSKSPPVNTSRGNFILGPGASLSTAGLVVDDRHMAANPLTPPISIKGGTITINSFNANLKSGSVIDVSGGVAVSATGKRTYGDGGAITVVSGQDLNVGSVVGGQLRLGSELRGFSAGGGSRSVGNMSGGGNGGSLSIQAMAVQIGGTSTNDNVLTLSPDFFNQGGFGSFALTGLGFTTSSRQAVPAFWIAPGTTIKPVVEAQAAFLTSTDVLLQPVSEPVGLRTPVNLTFNAKGVTEKFGSPLMVASGDFVLGTGATIQTDPKGSVTISGTTVAVLGSVIAPGGSISISASTLIAPTQALPNLDLGPKSLLSTAGTVVLLPDRRGYRTGTVLPGGSITVSGNIVAENGAVLDVSGTTGVLDLSPAYSNMSIPLMGSLSGKVVQPQKDTPAAAFRGLLVANLPDGTTTSVSENPSGSFSGAAVVATRVDSNAGSITLQGDSELFTDATLRGNAGGPTATGGSLSVSSGSFSPTGTANLTDTHLVVTQSGPTIPAPFYSPGQTAIGHPILGKNGTPLAGTGYFAVDQFMAGGFDSLALGGKGGTVTFSGPVTIKARNSLTIGDAGLIKADSIVSLSAPYVQLGTPFQAPTDQTVDPFSSAGIVPTYGKGQLNVSAQLIDIGNLSLQNIGRATFTAINGDIRGDGTLDVAGDIVFRAGQIYPASAVTFNIVGYTDTAHGQPNPGSVTILGAGTRPLPLSAAGTLNIYATNIYQGGVLSAPLGSINLGWDGTGTAPKDPLTLAGIKTGVSNVPIAQRITLAPGSRTSVSAIDPLTGEGVIIPYGLNLNGTSWIDPTGTDITANLLPQKSVNVAGINVNTQAGSVVDVRGGGDLQAYQWVAGTGGSSDVLSWNFAGAWTKGKSYSSTQIVSYNGAYWYARTASTTESLSQTPSAGSYWKQVTPSFAVIPGYQANYAPYARFNPSPIAKNAPNLGADQGYINDLAAAGNLGDGLTVGSSIYLGATPGLKAGVYTLLPARYALLPGAFLVTPQSTASVGTFNLTDDSTIVAGYRFSDVTQSTAHQLYKTVAVASSKVFGERASYTVYTANDYLPTRAEALGLQIPRTPWDAGSLQLSGSTSLTVNGNVLGKGEDDHRGAVIDLSTTADIYITGPHTATPPSTATVLNSTLLNSFGAESILIGGKRQSGADGVTVTVNTNNITVDNAGTPLVAPEIILVANKNLKLADGAAVEAKGGIPQSALFPTPSLLIGNSTVAGSGDGVLLRVSDTSAAIVRTNIDTSTAPNITIGANATVSGVNLTIDSTAGGTLDPTAKLNGQNVSLKAGSISIVLNDAGPLQPNPGIILEGSVLNNLLGTSALSLSGYNSIDIYGKGSITSGNLGLHTGDLRGFTNDPAGVVTINAGNLTLDNTPGRTGPGPAVGAPVQGSLVVNATTLFTGANTLNIDQYADVALTATSGVVLQNTGGISSQTNLTLTTPIIIGAGQANQTITAKGGAISILAPAGDGDGSTLANSAGLGAILNIAGTSVVENSRIYLPSGQINLKATGSNPATSNVLVGGTLDVSGTAQVFYDVTKYTDGGSISIQSANSGVTLAAGSVVSVAAQAGGGNAGSLSISVPKGDFVANGTLAGSGGIGGASGTFSLDVKEEPSLAALDATLNAAAMNASRTYRVRTNSVQVDGTAVAQTYNVSADSGNIVVTSTGNVDAHGVNGGTINLIASGSVTLQSGAMLNAHGDQFSSAGKGGAVSLEAGSEVNGNVNLAAVVDIQSGSTIDLSVSSLTTITNQIALLTPAQLNSILAPAYTPAQVAALTPSELAGLLYGDFTGTLHLRAPQNTTSTGLGVNPILGNIVDPSSIVVEGYRVFDLTGTGGTITSTGTNFTTVGSNGVITFNKTGLNVQGSVQAASATFVNNTTGLYSTLLAGNTNATQLGKVLSIAPGVELINRGVATQLTFTLASSGNTLVIPSTGGILYFPNGTGGNKIQSTVAGVITSASGVTTTLAANTATTIAAGSTVTLGGTATVTYSTGGSGGAIAVNLIPGTSFTTGATGTSGTVSGVGSSITLNTSGTSAINIPAAPTQTTVLVPAGTTGTTRIQSSVNATITSASGVVTTLVANTPTLIAAGSTITMPVGGGTLKYSSGGSGTIGLTLLAGSFTTTGIVGVTPATGNITLGTSSVADTSFWDLGSSNFRFGPKQVPGILTMRAAGNLVFFNSLTDGFKANNVGDPLYQYGLKDINAALPANAQSWSYRLTAGADFSAANFQAVRPLSQLVAATGSAATTQGLGTGSLLLGKNYGNTKLVVNGGGDAQASDVLSVDYQVIRTGSGDITINAGQDVQLLNQLATIYTAGTKVPNATILPDGSQFQLPILNGDSASFDSDLGVSQQNYTNTPQYSLGGGNVTLNAQGNITHLTRLGTTLTIALTPDASKELPINWLYRRGYVDASTGLFGKSVNGDIASTTWWVDFTNFFEGVGALGGGNVTLNAGQNISNVDGVVPTNSRMPIGKPDASKQIELGGGDLVVKAGGNIDGGTYYIERGKGTLSAGNSILLTDTVVNGVHTSPRSPSIQNLKNPNVYTSPLSWLPTTLFLGKGGFDVSARNDILLGPVVNPFLLPQSLNNVFVYKTYFSTYAPTDYVNVTSLAGSVTLRENAIATATSTATPPILKLWLDNVLKISAPPFTTNTIGFFQPWLRIDETSTNPFVTAMALQPPTLRVTAFTKDINIQGNLTLAPSPTGTIDLIAGGKLNALQPSGVATFNTKANTTIWTPSTINLSDADPASVYGITTPFAYQNVVGSNPNDMTTTNTNTPSFFTAFDTLFAESGQTNTSFLTQQALHARTPVHGDDPNPVHIYTGSGDISGLTLFSSKPAEILAGRDITDVAFYLQNLGDSDISVVSAGRDIVAYNASSALLSQASTAGNGAPIGPLAGDIQISGPGTLEVLAGRNLDLGNAPTNATRTPDGTQLGITSIGNARNPFLPFDGANLITAAGIGGPAELSNNPNLDLATFVTDFLNSGGSGSTNYLAELGIKNPDISSLSSEEQAALAVNVFFLVLRDAGRSQSAGTSGGGTAAGMAAIDKLFGNTTRTGNISLTTREIKTANGGDIQVLAPHGKVTVGFNVIGQALDQGIITESGGNIDIFADGDVSLGTSRIFTLRGGNIIIWSTNGSIAAGSASKTVKSAPPTRVLLDPRSADVKTDLAGLATGGGIGVLATVADVPPGNVDLIAPNGAVDAGDAGIRASGNLNISATRVLNADNIQVSGSSSGTPTAVAASAPNIGGLTAGNTSQAATSNAADENSKKQQQQAAQEDMADSTITVEVLGYGGGEGTSSSDPVPSGSNQ